ncbi:matrixin family metalloprotease [Patescibacteria group bacterium]|nr:matrixin family metalloprotease [Patescibacteria group bacterium]
MKKSKNLLVAISCLLFLVIAFSSKAVGAKPDFESASVNPSNNRAIVKIPEHAVEVAPGVFNLGTAMDNGKEVQGYAFVHYKKGYVKPLNANARKEPKCYDFLAKWTKWKTTEPYFINPTNTRELDETFIVDNLADNINKWEAEAGVEILENGTKTNEILEADFDWPIDNKNEVYFADVSLEGAIAVNIAWGVFSGPPDSRELLEWDQVYDDIDFDWGIGEEHKMDFENIATHELGHAVGLGDLYKDDCSEETMYGWASEGETNKRTLGEGDKLGIQELYGL